MKEKVKGAPSGFHGGNRFARQRRNIPELGGGLGIWENETVIHGSRQMTSIYMGKQSEATPFGEDEIRHLQCSHHTGVSLTRLLFAAGAIVARTRARCS